MTLLSAIRRKRYSAYRLGLIAFVWLSVLIGPCAQAFVLDEHADDVIVSSEVHAHSHDEPANSTSGQDCCCDQPEMIKADSVKTFKHIVLATPPLGLVFVSPVALHEAQGAFANPLVHTTSPPVYLHTQRLRI